MFIVKCIPLLQILAEDNKQVVITDYNNPALVGTNATFTCNSSSGLVFTGFNTTTCMENGEWEPDPREIDCEGNLYSPGIPIRIDFVLHNLSY